MTILETELILVRHGETEWNAMRRYQGHTDNGLSLHGRTQASALSAHFSAFRQRTPAVYTSDLVRARETAELICPWAAVECDARLRELHFGAFEGLTYEDNLQRFGRRFSKWIADPMKTAPPDGESVAALNSRLSDWLGAIAGKPLVIAFTHGGVVRALLSRAAGLPFDARLSVPPASVVHMHLRQCDRTTFMERVS